MIFGAILAGGVGSRMNIADMPKQFLPLGEKPIIIHTLNKFLSSKRIDYIYIGVHPEWYEHMISLIDKYFKEQKNKFRVVTGGGSRNDTIFNIVNAIEKDFGENDENIILTHDSVRPFVTEKMINENIDGTLKYGAVNTISRAVDTIVISDGDSFVESIPDRSRMYHGQCPQSFNISLLKKYYALLTEEQKASLTDACKIFVLNNKPVYIVEGDYTNLKITTMGDYKIAQAVEQILREEN